MTTEEHEAVKEILLDWLRTIDNEQGPLYLTPDETAELQTAIWMVLADHDDTERRRVAALTILTK